MLPPSSPELSAPSEGGCWRGGRLLLTWYLSRRLATRRRVSTNMDVDHRERELCCGTYRSTRHSASLWNNVSVGACVMPSSFLTLHLLRKVLPTAPNMLIFHIPNLLTIGWCTDVIDFTGNALQIILHYLIFLRLMLVCLSWLTFEGERLWFFCGLSSTILLSVDNALRPRQELPW